MINEQELDKLDAAYKEHFGTQPDFRWYRGDIDAYAALIRRAIADKRRLPDYNKAHAHLH